MSTSELPTYVHVPYKHVHIPQGGGGKEEAGRERDLNGVGKAIKWLMMAGTSVPSMCSSNSANSNSTCNSSEA